MGKSALAFLILVLGAGCTPAQPRSEAYLSGHPREHHAPPDADYARNEQEIRERVVVECRRVVDDINFWRQEQREEVYESSSVRIAWMEPKLIRSVIDFHEFEFKGDYSVSTKSGRSGQGRFRGTVCLSDGRVLQVFPSAYRPY